MIIVSFFSRSTRDQKNRKQSGAFTYTKIWIKDSTTSPKMQSDTHLSHWWEQQPTSNSLSYQAINTIYPMPVSRKNKMQGEKGKRQQSLFDLGQHVSQERWNERVSSLRGLWPWDLRCQIILNVNAPIIGSLIHWNTKWILNHGCNPVTTLRIEAMISSKSYLFVERERKKRKKGSSHYSIYVTMFVLHVGRSESILSVNYDHHDLLCLIILNVDPSTIGSLIHWNTKWIVNHGYNPVTTLVIEAMISSKSYLLVERERKKRKKGSSHYSIYVTMFVLHFGERVFLSVDYDHHDLLCLIILNVDASIIDSLIRSNTRWYEQMARIVNPPYYPVTTLLIEAMISFKIVSVRRERKKRTKKRQQSLFDLCHHVCPSLWRVSLFSPWTMIITIFSVW